MLKLIRFQYVHNIQYLHIKNPCILAENQLLKVDAKDKKIHEIY